MRKTSSRRSAPVATASLMAAPSPAWFSYESAVWNERYPRLSADVAAAYDVQDVLSVPSGSGWQLPELPSPTDGMTAPPRRVTVLPSGRAAAEPHKRTAAVARRRVRRRLRPIVPTLQIKKYNSSIIDSTTRTRYWYTLTQLCCTTSTTTQQVSGFRTFGRTLVFALIYQVEFYQ